MTNDITNHSAGIHLSEDFVNRALAMRGGKNLDDAFLMDLLEAGLAIMELSAGNHDERCSNPDCAGCRIRTSEPPSPTIMAEFAEVLAQLHRSAERSEAGEPVERPITIMVSETSLIFMAWLDRMGRYVLVPHAKAATAFLFELIARLQASATVPMIDVRAYARWLE